MPHAAPRLLAALVATATPLLAQLPDKLPPLTFDSGRGAFEIIERLRYEDRSNTFDFDGAAHAPTDGDWFVQRVRLGATYKAAPDLAFNIQLQDAREWGSDRPKVPFILGAEGNDPLDLRLASFTWGDPKTSPVQLTLGRQTLVLGEERLVGIGEWNNFARTFDAAKAVWTVSPATTVTAFVSSVVNVTPTTSNAGWKFDRSSTDDLFSGVAFSHKLTPRDTVEAYALWRDKKDNDPIYTAPNAAIPVAARSAAAYDIAQDIYTLGARWLRAPKPGAVDAEFEAAFQGGHVNRQTTTFTGPYGGSTAELDQQSWALHALVGFTPEAAPGKLRFNLEYNLASGDSHRTDDKNGSFMNLFPSNHKFYGFMDVFAWKNLEELVATVRFAPHPKLAVRADWHNFALFTTSDAWYRANGVATVRPLNAAARAASRDAGAELDLTATWTLRPYVIVDLGWSQFFAGSYLGGTGASSDARFFYAQTTLKF